MGSQGGPPIPKELPYFMRRVKVYRLDDEGNWDDQGTGLITVDHLERSEDMGLSVIDEANNETLLLHRISSDDIYRKQNDTIIVWRDPDFATELALSFQETTGCSYIWNHICSLQRNAPFILQTNTSDGTIENMNTEVPELPPIELSTLPVILKTVVESSITDQLHVTDLILKDLDFFRKLMELFRISEDLGNVDDLHLIFKIVRGIISLNSSPIFEKIFGDELIMDIIGCLEYDPNRSRAHHRDFLKNHVVFEEVIPISDPFVISKIHQTYRVGYVKDVILPSELDDVVLNNLTSIVLANNTIVVSILKNDRAFVKELFARLKSSTTSVESKKTLVNFLHEFCMLSKSLQMLHQIRLFRDFVNQGLFDVVTDLLQSEVRKLALTGAEIILQSVALDPNILRSYVALQKDGFFSGLLVKNMLTDFGGDMHCQFYEIVLSLLDSSVSGTQNETIVEVFYEKHLTQLIDVLKVSCSPLSYSHNKSASSDDGLQMRSIVKPEILLNILNLLCFCVSQHPYRIKCNFLLNNVIEKVLCVTRRKEKYLVVAAIRFLRMLVANRDEHIMNYLVKNNIFKPIVDVFVANGDRYNLLNSAILNLFEYIRKENSNILLRHLVDAFWDQLGQFERSLPSIHALKVKYEQSLESVVTMSSSGMSDQRKRIDDRALEKEEEDYFNEHSDDEDSASTEIAKMNTGQSQPSTIANDGPWPSITLTRSGRLVDYDDDEDDEDYRPPPSPKGKADASSDEDELVTGLPLKRKLVIKRNEPNPKGLRFTGKVVLPSDKAVANTPQPDPNNDPTKPGTRQEHLVQVGNREVNLAGELSGSAREQGNEDSHHHCDQIPRQEMNVNGSFGL